MNLRPPDPPDAARSSARESAAGASAAAGPPGAPPPTPKGRHLSASALAILLMLAAGALVAVTSLLAKALGGSPGVEGASSGLSPFQVSAGRFVFALLTLGIVFAVAPPLRPTLKGARWRWHLMRSVCGWLGVTSMFAAVAQMPVAEATAISFLSPLVAMALAVGMLGERIGLRKVLAAGCAVAGAVLILRPGSEAFQIAGLFALAAALFMGLETIFIKRLSDTEPTLRVLLINNLIGATLSAGVAALVWTAPTPVQWALLVAIGVVMVSAQVMFIQSMKRGDASFVAPAFYSVLLFASLYDYAIYGVVPNLTGTLGGLLILAGALILAAQRTPR
ncbi:MAG: DMT family transporter [Pseudomonadota bacterium]